MGKLAESLRTSRPKIRRRCDTCGRVALHFQKPNGRHYASCVGCRRAAARSYRTTPRARARSSWAKMLARCTDTRHPSFKNYGGRGISVCAAWAAAGTGLAAFLRDMGLPPAGAQLDRRDNDGPYCKDNCRWATLAEQKRNTSRNVFVTIGGVTKVIKDWAIERGLNPKTVYVRLHRGSTPLAALGG